MSSPLDGVSVGDTPAVVRLTFTEKPEASLSEIHVTDGAGTRYDAGRPTRPDDDPLSLQMAVRRLNTGVYTVTWRIVSAVDGHATSGAYAFGVRASPSGVPVQPPVANVAVSEIAARWMLLTGLVLLLGAALAHVARFAGPRDLAVAAAGWGLAAAGLAALAWIQKRGGATALATLLTTSIGRALMWRAGALVAAAGALVVAHSSRERSETRLQAAAMAVAAISALGAMAAHVSAGHAAADARPALDATVQWAHLAACGVWIGGLATLLLGVDRPSPGVTARVRRFSAIAAASLVVVLVSGLLRALQAFASWRDVVDTGYGRALLVKVSLFLAIAALAGFNRWRSVPLAPATLRPLRTAGGAELVSAAAALAAAALLAALAPPVSLRPPPGISVSAADFGTTVRAALSAASDQPGPNRFAVRITDYDSGEAVDAQRIVLRFSSVDDPELPPTSLPLVAQGEGLYAASGANLSLDGRWKIVVGVTRQDSSVDVPMQVSIRGRAQQVEVTPLHDGLVRYGAELRNAGILRVEVDPRRIGRTTAYVSCLDFILDQRPVSHVTATLSNRNGAEQELALRAAGVSRFAADVDLARGVNTIAVVAHTPDGIRMRAVFPIQVPR